METGIKERIVQDQEYRIVGMSRSGNHAIINWILNQINGRYCFLNCTEPKFNPFETARPLSEEGNSYQTNITGFNQALEQQGNFSTKDYLLYSHEDCFLGALHKAPFKKCRNKWVGQSLRRRDILILRDPFNLFASRIKSGLMRGHFTHHGARPISNLTVKRIYKQHAREFLAEKNYLKDKVLINYNEWIKEREYRRKLSENLAIPFTDKGFGEVTAVAGGSSFDGTKLSGQAHKMNLLSRWKEFASNEEFWELFDDEIVELSRAIFGETPALKYFEENYSLLAS